jgi:hypothetical protein
MSRAKQTQVTIALTEEQLARIEKVVKLREKDNPFIKRADVLRELLMSGLEALT